MEEEGDEELATLSRGGAAGLGTWWWNHVTLVTITMEALPVARATTEAAADESSRLAAVDVSFTGGGRGEKVKGGLVSSPSSLTVRRWRHRSPPTLRFSTGCGEPLREQRARHGWQ